MLTVPANHNEYFFINTGFNSQLQAISGGGMIGFGTTKPSSMVTLSGSAFPTITALTTTGAYL